MSNSKRSIAPDVHIIESFTNNSAMSWSLGFGELIDNSFGAGATRVDITFFKDHVIAVQDNGSGVEDIVSLFQFGSSLNQHVDGNIGRFGIGAKAACAWMASNYTVQTQRDGQYATEHVNWQHVVRSGTWPVLDGTFVPVETVQLKDTLLLDADGTQWSTAIILNGRHSGRRGAQIENLKTYLGRIYRPALDAGLQINLFDCRSSKHRDFEVKAVRPPKLSDRVDFKGEVELSEGGTLTFCGHAGAMLGEIKNVRAHSGLHIAYGHRLIREATRLCSATLPQQIYIYVELGSEWKQHLTAHKDGLALFQHEFESALYEHVEELIANTQEIVESLRVEEINTQIMRALGGAGFKLGGDFATDPDDDGLPDKEPGGDGPPKPPPVEPGPRVHGTRGKRKDQPGNKQDDPGAGDGDDDTEVHGIVIKWVSMGEDETVYTVDRPDDCLVVSLNTDHSHVKQAQAHPFRISEAWPVISSAVSEVLLECDPCTQRKLFKPLDDHFDQLGDFSLLPHEVHRLVYRELMSKQPVVKQPEIDL